jgi:hypothetical protein
VAAIVLAAGALAAALLMKGTRQGTQQQDEPVASDEVMDPAPS